MDLFKLLGTIAIDNSDANKALDDTSQKGEKTESKLSGAFSKIGKGAAVVGKAVVTGLAAGGAAMATLTVKALNMSGELEQNMGGSEAVFGKYAGKMQETAKKAFSEMGLATSDYLATANKMGALFQGAGFSIEDSMNLSSDAMQRAADVASIMGIDTSAAMEAIAGAAKGNFTMMDNLGVAMNDTTLQAYALEKGIKKSTTEMTNQEKIGLAMEMFMEKTAYAAGNYAKENETLAGSLGTAKAALTNFLDGSGGVDELVTSFSNAANVIVDNVKTLAPRLISGISEVVSQIVPLLPPLLQEIFPALVDGAVMLINGLIGQLPLLLDMLINDFLPLLVNAAIQVTAALIAAFPQLAIQIVQSIPQIFTIIWDAISVELEKLIAIIIEFATPVIDGFKNIWDKVTSVISDAWETIKNFVKTGLMLVGSIIDAGIQIITLPFQLIWENCKEYVFAAWEWIKSKVSVAINAVKSVITNVMNSIKSFLSPILDTIKSNFSKVWNSIKTTITNVMNSIKSKITSIWNSIKSSISSAVNSVKSTVTTKFNQIKTAITQPIETAKTKIKSLIDSIKGFFNNMKLSLPKIKLPHFKVTGKLSIDPPSVPKLSIEWYKRAMGNPIVMNEPTIFGYNPATGSFMGGGEAGSEVVSGTNTLMNMIQSAVATENGAIVYYLQKLIEILADYFPQVLDALDFGFDSDYFIKKNASKIDSELGRLHAGKVRGR